MNHTVTISIAPVIAILDDEADLLNMVAIPLTIALWVPCRFFAAWGNLHAWLYRARCALADYRRGWAADLELMSQAVRSLWRIWAGCPNWSIGAG